MNSQTIQNISLVETVICIAGNDGTGKSTLLNYINQQLRQNKPQYYCIQRSHKACPQQFKPLIKELKLIDQLTFNYAFQDQRKNFQKSDSLTFKFIGQNGLQQQKSVKVCWFMLDLQPQKIQKRLHTRTIVDIYDSKKAVQYYSFIYRQFAWYYGFPLIYADQKTSQIVQQIVRSIQSQFYDLVSSTKFQSVNLDFINERNIQHQIQIFLQNFPQDATHIYELTQHAILNQKISQFYCLCPQFNDLFNSVQNVNKQQVTRFQNKLSARWILKNGIIQLTDNNNVSVTYPNFKTSTQQSLILKGFSGQMIYLKIHDEGESKILYSIHSFLPQVEQYFKGKIIICLKSTIYSHTKQHTGEIANLAQIRALGNILFLEMMRRNNLKHAYLSINHENGIILSQFVKTNQLQIIFKKQCLGTDKHSYNAINTISEIVDKNNCYTSGIYIRFDWRNPNHFLVKNPNLVINADPYYYVIEKYFGKQQFFKLFLINQNIKPMGDKCISEDILRNYASTRKIKKNTLRVYSTFLYYSRKIGLQILDGCFMFDSQGDITWSEINPDCMRVKSIKDKQDYDKDIWRYGGSSKRQDIVKKWTLFNSLFIDWFQKNRYHNTQLLQIPQLGYPHQQICRSILQQNSSISEEYSSYYRQLSSQKLDKRLIGTIDISDGKPILVKSSVISESHTEDSLNKAYQHISLLSDIVLVDIDAAIDKDKSGLKNNRQNIKQLVDKNRTKVLAVGGGIRNQQVLNYYLNKVKCKNIILSSNLDLLKLMKIQDISERVVVQLSINQQNQILIKGRSQNTHINVITKIQQLIQYGVKTISITFNNCQGHLNGIPRKQIVQLYSQIPQHIEKIIIAGGISSMDDLNFIWGFKRCIPQLGSAIWKNKISISDIYQSLVRFNNEGLVVAIIVNQNQKIMGQIFLNKQALKLSCEKRKLYRYSRQHQRVMKKGQTSSNVFDILDFKLDCDNDSIIIKVKPQEKKDVMFCHKNQYSCFSEKIRKNDINTLQSHILSRKQNGSGYTKRMMQHEGLAAMKIVQEVQQLHISEHNKVHEAADLMAHLIMYFNAHNISTNQIMSELEKRSIDTIKLQKSVEGQNKRQISLARIQCPNFQTNSQNLKVVGIIGGKHFDRIDKLTQGIIGIKVNRALNRSSKIDFQIVNTQIYKKAFGDSKIHLVGIKSKDMATITAKGLVSYCVNYSIMMQNYPNVCKQIMKVPTPGIVLALLGRKNEKIDFKSWNTKMKGVIVCEYPFSVNRYFKSLGINQNTYTLIRVSGGTQSYLASETFKADFCDAIVQSGKTVQDNDLKIVAVLEQTISAGFYEAL